MSADVTTTWNPSGTYFESCNCDAACPCVVLSDPSEGDCTVLVGWHIDEGHTDEVALDGLNVALAVHSPGNMAHVPWTVALYLDERGDGKQSDALTRIFTGQLGGHPQRLVSHIGHVLGITSAAIEFETDGRRRSLRIGDVGAVEIEAIDGQQDEPVTVTGHPLAIAPGYPAVLGPMVIAYTDLTRRVPTGETRLGGVASFLSGYVLVWVGLSLLAAMLQVLLERAGLLTAMGAASRPEVGGAVLVFAGLFQLTPWKESCLRRCRTPIGFLIAEWRDGAAGALIMGVRHGAYCVGCCWLLMAVLFVVGTMHLVWMAVITVFVLAEKVAARALRVGLVSALFLIGWDASILLTAAA